MRVRSIVVVFWKKVVALVRERSYSLLMNDAITAAIRTYLATLGDVTSAEAMRGKCMDASYGLAAALTGLTYTDSWDDEITVEAHPVQMWDAPAAIAGNPMAHGHYVCCIVADGDRYYVDCTAAQFPELGHTGPAASESLRWDAFSAI